MISKRIALFMLLVDVELAVDELYNSAVFVTTPLLDPPLTKTFPFLNVVAVWSHRFKCMLSALVQLPVDGSYNSVLFRQ